jgi:dimethylargininase
MYGISLMKAIVRKPDSSIANCALTYMVRKRIDFDLALRQNLNYQDVLRKNGFKVIELPALEGFSDATFVEDTAVVTEEFVVAGRLGIEERRGEVESVAVLLKNYRNIHQIDSPGLLEGGDVLVIGRTIFAGFSSRTDKAGLHQFKNFVAPFGFRFNVVEVSGSLHLKTGYCYVGKNTILLNPKWIDRSHFRGFDIIEVDPSEPFGANALVAPEKVLLSSAFPKTRVLLEQAGFYAESIDISEFEKAEAGLTCMSLIA